mmetsp:Transcript_21409/g.36799  ORF Transcript_21409/g.36799 Transcript_21409/m.36799 type:complete len:241 (-) Transcript_21409:935-1657(-)
MQMLQRDIQFPLLGRRRRRAWGSSTARNVDSGLSLLGIRKQFSLLSPFLRGLPALLCFLLLLCNLFVLLFHHANQDFYAPTQLCRTARLKEPVKSELPCSASFQFELLPSSVTQTPCHTNQPTVLFFGKRLSSISGVRDFQLAPWVFIALTLQSQSLLHLLSPHDLDLPFLNGLLDLGPVLEMTGPLLPKALAIRLDLLKRLGFAHVLPNGFQVLATMSLTCSAKREELTLIPVAKPFIQ